MNAVGFNVNLKISEENAEKFMDTFNQNQHTTYRSERFLFENMGFGCVVEDGYYDLFCYRGKWNNTAENFFKSLAPFVEQGSSICFKDTMGKAWRFFYWNGEALCDNATEVLLWGNDEGGYLHIKDEGDMEKIKSFLQEEDIQYIEANSFKDALGLFGVDCTFM